MKRNTKLYKAVFRTKIDFKDGKTNQYALTPGGKYYFNDGCITYDDIVNEAVQITNHDLKAELQKYTFISIKEVNVQAVYEGSIEIVFSVVLGFLEFIGGLKNLYDTTRLICEISERHINKKLSSKFGRYFEVDTYTIMPNRHDQFVEQEINNEQNLNRKENRDSFFYYESEYPTV